MLLQEEEVTEIHARGPKGVEGRASTTETNGRDAEIKSRLTLNGMDGQIKLQGQKFINVWECEKSGFQCTWSQIYYGKWH